MNLKLPAMLCALFVIESNAGALKGDTHDDDDDGWIWDNPKPTHDTAITVWTTFDKGGRERRLHEFEITELDNCSNELYQISGKTSGKEGHVLLVAKPECNESEGEACTCPLLSFDSRYDDNGNLDNAIHVMTGAGDDKEALNLGAFPLSTILDAFATASVKNSGTEYDFLDNNCASFMISMLVELGIDLSDKKIISFTVQQISSEFLLNKLLEADTEKIHNDIYDSQNDAVVVEEFISNYILERI